MAAEAAGAPPLAVVVASWNGAASLRACLASLRGQSLAGALEIVVARDFEVPSDLFSGTPGVVDVPMPAGTSVAGLRAAGLARTTGSAVAFIEDHCTCDNGWADALLRAHQTHAAVGGPVEQGEGASPVDWAVYFYDYGRYMPPCEAGPADQLSGLNMSFGRVALEEVREATRAGIHEAELQALVRGRGHALYLAPGAVVTHRGRRTTRDAMRQAFALARGYAGRRVAGGSPMRRAIFGAGTLVLPAVLGSRIVAATLHKRRHRGALCRSLPWLLLLLVSWSAGEAAGYLGLPRGVGRDT